MVDESPGPGWEQGLDGKWRRVIEALAPHAAPRHVVPSASTLTPPQTVTPKATSRSARGRPSKSLLTGIVVLVVVAGVAIGVLVANAGSSPSSTTAGGFPAAAPLDLHRPSAADLERLAPGAVDVSSSVKPSDEAPLLCGGVVASHLLGATIVAIPNSLSRISVLEYGFSSAGALQRYIHELLPAVVTGPSGRYCTLAVANSGAFYPAGLFLTNNSTWEASAATSYSSGPYAGSYSYSTFEYAPQGSDLFLIRVDKQNGYPDEPFMDVVLNTINAPGSPKLNTGGHSKVPSTVKGVLQRAPYAVIPPEGPQASTANFDCPEVVIGSVPYSLVFENQLTNVQPAGLIVFSGSNGAATTTIPWGASITMVVDTFGTTSSETTFGCGTAKSPASNFANVLSVAERQ